ncbi:MAG TPA: hypothetical protein VIG26_03025, partial [Methyloceanibacter sp.]
GMPPRPAAPMGGGMPRPGGMGGAPTPSAPRPATPGMGTPSAPPRPTMPGSGSQPYRPSWARDDDKDDL